ASPLCPNLLGFPPSSSYTLRPSLSSSSSSQLLGQKLNSVSSASSPSLPLLSSSSSSSSLLLSPPPTLGGEEVGRGREGGQKSSSSSSFVAARSPRVPPSASVYTPHSQTPIPEASSPSRTPDLPFSSEVTTGTTPVDVSSSPPRRSLPASSSSSSLSVPRLEVKGTMNAPLDAPHTCATKRPGEQLPSSSSPSLSPTTLMSPAAANTTEPRKVSSDVSSSLRSRGTDDGWSLADQTLHVGAIATSLSPHHRQASSSVVGRETRQEGESTRRHDKAVLGEDSIHCRVRGGLSSARTERACIISNPPEISVGEGSMRQIKKDDGEKGRKLQGNDEDEEDLPLPLRIHDRGPPLPPNRADSSSSSSSSLSSSSSSHRRGAKVGETSNEKEFYARRSLDSTEEKERETTSERVGMGSSLFSSSSSQTGGTAIGRDTIRSSSSLSSSSPTIVLPGPHPPVPDCSHEEKDISPSSSSHLPPGNSGPFQGPSRSSSSSSLVVLLPLASSACGNEENVAIKASPSGTEEGNRTCVEGVGEDERHLSTGVVILSPSSSSSSSSQLLLSSDDKTSTPSHTRSLVKKTTDTSPSATSYSLNHLEEEAEKEKKKAIQLVVSKEREEGENDGNEEEEEEETEGMTEHSVEDHSSRRPYQAWPGIPLPLDPHARLVGIEISECWVVKSSLYPLVLACWIFTPVSIRLTGGGGEGEAQERRRNRKKKALPEVTMSRKEPVGLNEEDAEREERSRRRENTREKEEAEEGGVNVERREDKMIIAGKRVREIEREEKEEKQRIEDLTAVNRRKVEEIKEDMMIIMTASMHATMSKEEEEGGGEQKRGLESVLERINREKDEEDFNFPLARGADPLQRGERSKGEEEKEEVRQLGGVSFHAKEKNRILKEDAEKEKKPGDGSDRDRQMSVACEKYEERKDSQEKKEAIHLTEKRGEVMDRDFKCLPDTNSKTSAREKASITNVHDHLPSCDSDKFLPVSSARSPTYPDNPFSFPGRKLGEGEEESRGERKVKLVGDAKLEEEAKAEKKKKMERVPGAAGTLVGSIRSSLSQGRGGEEEEENEKDKKRRGEVEKMDDIEEKRRKEEKYGDSQSAASVSPSNDQHMRSSKREGRGGSLSAGRLEKKLFLYKAGDDLRQDMLVLQIISIIDCLFKQYGLDLKLTPYRVVAFSTDDGLIEFVQGAECLSSIKKKHKNLINYFTYLHPDPNSPCGFSKRVLSNFIRSCAGSSLVTFLLGIGDRHLDNILVRHDGRLCHIDFGFILGEDPKPFPPPMKICSEMLEVLGGIGGEGYNLFVAQCCQGYKILRRHANLLCVLLDLMIDSGIKDIKKNLVVVSSPSPPPLPLPSSSTTSSSAPPSPPILSSNPSASHQSYSFSTSTSNSNILPLRLSSKGNLFGSSSTQPPPQGNPSSSSSYIRTQSSSHSHAAAGAGGEKEDMSVVSSSHATAASLSPFKESPPPTKNALPVSLPSGGVDVSSSLSPSRGEGGVGGGDLTIDPPNHKGGGSHRMRNPSVPSVASHPSRHSESPTASSSSCHHSVDRNEGKGESEGRGSAMMTPKLSERQSCSPSSSSLASSSPQLIDRARRGSVHTPQKTPPLGDPRQATPLSSHPPDTSRAATSTVREPPPPTSPLLLSPVRPLIDDSSAPKGLSGKGETSSSVRSHPKSHHVQSDNPVVLLSSSSSSSISSSSHPNHPSSSSKATSTSSPSTLVGAASRHLSPSMIATTATPAIAPSGLVGAGLIERRKVVCTAVDKVKEKLRLDLNDEDAERYLVGVITSSAKALFPAVVDKLHEWALYWR
ncbi:phosphatidylinositol 3- and 4-kinase, partial [Cystoisospora suis]